MHCPKEPHWIHLKWMYLKDSASDGLLIQKAKTIIILAFSDADWGGDLDDRSSASGYIVYLGSTPISWKSVTQKMIA